MRSDMTDISISGASMASAVRLSKIHWPLMIPVNALASASMLTFGRINAG